jgi:hypothetical protein
MSINEQEEMMKHREKLASIQESQNQRRAEMVQSSYTYNETPFNGEKSKEMIEFELSEASPVRKSQYSYGTGQFSVGASGGHKPGQYPNGSGLSQSRKKQPTQPSAQQQPAGSSSVNLEKAYEELEREIQEIKQKLHHSINQNESQSDVNQSSSYVRR